MWGFRLWPWTKGEKGGADGGLQTLNRFVVQNDTLCYLALGYGLPTLYAEGIQNSGQKAAADLFEAIVGAFSLDETQTGDRIFKKWIACLFSSSVFPDCDLIAQSKNGRNDVTIPNPVT